MSYATTTTRAQAARSAVAPSIYDRPRCETPEVRSLAARLEAMLHLWRFSRAAAEWVDGHLDTPEAPPLAPVVAVCVRPGVYRLRRAPR